MEPKPSTATAADSVPILSSDRIALRRFRREDIDALAPIFADAEMMSFYPEPFSRARSAEWIEWNLRLYSIRGYGLWALVWTETEELIGDCGLVDQVVDGESHTEIGWHVARPLWSRGIGTEAALVVRDHAFGQLGLSHLISLIRPENVPSRRVAEKIGLSVWKETDRNGLAHLVYRLDSP